MTLIGKLPVRLFRFNESSSGAGFLLTISVNSSPEMKQKLRILLEYLSAFVLIILLLLAIASVVVIKFYGDDLKLYAMEVINNRLDSTIDVEEIDVKVFQKFPLCFTPA